MKERRAFTLLRFVSPATDADRHPESLRSVAGEDGIEECVQGGTLIQQDGYIDCLASAFY